ncbi:polysaccharide deacetylase family protein [Halocatena marina]|uniref:Polysaccharide deacetylase family protein n=2 Tax=Halocatena marina TaxID=2934937 RepID=A0ABD5YL81_9EURY|nr:polysaccharide deacetylase family protein [Halocatena marina]
MRRPSTRRKFLATLGTAGTISIAGCSAVLPTGPSTNGDQSSTSTAQLSDSSGSGTDSGTDAEGTGTPSPGSKGEVIEDFEGDVGSRWQVDSGKYTVDSKKAFNGSQSLVLKGTNNGKQEEENGVSIYRSFYDSNEGGLDLSAHDLSMAVRFEKPVRGRIGVEFIAPAESSKLTSRHFLPKELNGWTQLDFGFTSKTGQPVMKSVQELRISVSTAGEPISVGIDDIRKLPRPKKGKVIFQFDDSHISTYTKAFPELKKRKWPGGVAVIPDSINTEQNMTRDNMREMGKAGWDMMSHPPVSKPLPQHPAKEQERQIRQSKQQLEQWGFDRGARHIVAPYGRISTETIEIMKKYHEANYIFGGSPGNAAQPGNMYTIPRVHGTSPEDVNAILDVAEQYNQLVVVAYHEIDSGTNTSVSMDGFRTVLDHVKKKDMDVVSPSEFIDSLGN